MGPVAKLLRSGEAPEFRHYIQPTLSATRRRHLTPHTMPIARVKVPTARVKTPIAPVKNADRACLNTRRGASDGQKPKTKNQRPNRIDPQLSNN